MKRKSFLLISLILTFNINAYGAGIKGRVSVTSQVQQKGSGLSALYQRSVSGAGDTRNEKKAVLFIRDFPGSDKPEPVQNAKIAQKNLEFQPNILPVTVGTEVSFPNMDMVYHNVFSLSNTKEFDLGRYSEGKSKSVLFDKPGIVEVFCEIHSHMHAYIIVVPNRFYAVTDASGNYFIKDLPPGNYVLVAWVENQPVKEIPVTVPASGDLELNIEF